MRSGTPARARTSAVEKLVGRITARSKPAVAHLVREARAPGAARVTPGGVVDEDVVHLLREAVQLGDPRAREDGEPSRRVRGLERAERGARHDDVADPVRRPHERLHARASERREELCLDAGDRPLDPCARRPPRAPPRRAAPGVPGRGGGRARPPPTRRDRATARGRPRLRPRPSRASPPTSCPTTGHPAAIASTRTSGPPSLAEGRSMRWLRREARSRVLHLARERAAVRDAARGGERLDAGARRPVAEEERVRVDPSPRRAGRASRRRRPGPSARRTRPRGRGGTAAEEARRSRGTRRPGARRGRRRSSPPGRRRPRGTPRRRRETAR